MSVILGLVPGNKGDTSPYREGFIDGTAIPVYTPRNGASVGTFGAAVTPDATSLPDAASAVPLRHFADLFYFRIWAIPNIVDAQNPKVGSPIPFKLWNAYLEPNEVENIIPTNATGVTLDLEEGEIFEPLELKTVHAVIDETAPYSIDANFEFDFTYGGTLLRFIALLADILPIEPNEGINERFEWKTDILQNYDGTEQRIALRPRPRRTFEVSMTLIDDVDRKKLYDKIFKTAALTVIAPSYQYQSRLKKKTVIADNKLYTNPKRADLRQDENVIVFTKKGEAFLFKIAAVNEDHVVITTAFSQVIPAGSVVSGGFAGRFPNKSGLSMNAIGGQSSLKIELVDSRDQLPYPSAGISLPTIKGKPMLLRNPLADGETAETFDVGLETIDNETGKPQFYTAWTQPFVEGARKYLCQTLLEPQELEFWRTFLQYCRGQQRAFYTPTYRQDLKRVEGTDFLVSQIEVEGSDYATQYFASETYRQLQIETSVGTFEVEVENVENNGTSTTLNFTAPIDADLTDAEIYRISYLMLVRLGSDTVTLTHNNTYTIVGLDIRAAVE